MRDLVSNYPLNFRHWNHDMFVCIRILSGCDYCEGIPGVGIQTARKLLRIHRSQSKIFRALRAAGKLPVGFEESKSTPFELLSIALPAFGLEED